MHEPRQPDVTRPTVCPSCGSKSVGTLAKVISLRTLWRCHTCEKTWTLAPLRPIRLPSW